jgi:hypothetical protein
MPKPLDSPNTAGRPPVLDEEKRKRVVAIFAGD